MVWYGMVPYHNYHHGRHYHFSNNTANEKHQLFSFFSKATINNKIIIINLLPSHALGCSVENDVSPWRSVEALGSESKTVYRVCCSVESVDLRGASTEEIKSSPRVCKSLRSLHRENQITAESLQIHRESIDFCVASTEEIIFLQ